MNLSEHASKALNQALVRSGMRSTRQRERVFQVLLNRRDHPTADEVYARTRIEMPTISLATVYNCLETLVECGLVRQVNWEREPSRYCPNLAPHAHFHCVETGRVYDIDLSNDVIKSLTGVLPEGFDAETVELSFRGKGKCPPSG